ncbi:MAG TPA: oligopeptide/dipeptide ABC transporter ATP-binding protein, partial [Bacillota bacterium]|nr:oligopeptide/dipeptide ABC transporter ATP-binding protein [Bacillota bacterium]
YLGKFVEIADKKSLFTNPQHPYTKALLSAIPTIHADQKKERILLSGDVPSPIDPPTGCRFHTRCPFATEICVREAPVLRQTEEMENGHVAACHHMEEIRKGTHTSTTHT